MGRPATLLEELCAHVQSFSAQSLDVRCKDGSEWVFANKGGVSIGIANFKSSTSEAKDLRKSLYAAAKRPVRTALNGRAYILKARIFDDFGEDAFTVLLEPAPKFDPSRQAFTAKQGQYLAFIYNYTKIHGRAPAESDLERYFRVSPPVVQQMIKTLERNGLIGRTPGQARSIRLLIESDKLPRLE